METSCVIEAIMMNSYVEIGGSVMRTLRLRVFDGILILALSLVACLGTTHASEKATCTGEGVRIRSSDSLSGTVVGKLSRGEEVRILSRSSKVEKVEGTEGQWVKIEAARGLTGWVFGKYLQPVVGESLNVLTPIDYGFENMCEGEGCDNFDPTSLYQPGTPLCKAILTNSTPMFDSLIGAGADVNLGQPLCIAAKNGLHEIEKKLITKGAKVPDQCEVYSNVTPLELAIQSGSAPTVRVLLEAGADPNGRSPQSPYYPIMLAVGLSSGSIEVIQALIDHGADINREITESAYEETTALHQACSYHSDTKLVEFLILRGARVNSKQGWPSPLGIAASTSDNIDVMRTLVRNGADLNHVAFMENIGSASPLMAAAFMGKVEVVKFLLDAGADPQLKIETGATALDFAKSKSKTVHSQNLEEVIKLLSK